jgi:hypothetical protein
MKRIFFISAGVIGILIGMGFVTPAVAQYRHEGAMTREENWLCLLGSVLTIGGLTAAFLGGKRHLA